MSIQEIMHNIEQNLEPEQPEENMEMSQDAFPPKLEMAEKTEEMPPKMEATGDMTFGESNDVRYARNALARAIASGNKVAIKHREEDLAKAIAKEAQKELERKYKK